MKKPIEPLRSGAYDYDREFDEKRIAAKWYIHPEIIERVIERAEDYLEEGETVLPHEEWWYDTEVFTLQELLDMTKGINPEEVVINIHRDRQVEDITVAVIHKTPSDKKARKKLRDAEMKDYNERRAIYEKEKIEYDKWKTEQEIQELQNKLSTLKNKSP